MNRKEFATQLKEKRAKKGWTQLVLGEKAGIVEHRIVRYETRRSAPDDLDMQKLTDALGPFIEESSLSVVVSA